ncbi:hypothetical protein [Burkholderia anthina]|uniref:hypothetical protein n=1 Tax=Burkholderia anthina TaxID=179879 RepID=UPI00158CA9D7|nr:hypothetical protein [Burkholderia anthina]
MPQVNCRIREDGAIEFASVADFCAALTSLAPESPLPADELAKRVAALTVKALKESSR